MGLDLGYVLPKLMFLSKSDEISIDAITLFVGLLCTCIVVGHLLETNRWVNESITALIIGLGTGVMILIATGGRNSHILIFNEELFFIYLLPPIIFNAGFQVKKKHFFHNFLTINLFGVVGTLISFVVISLGAAKLFEKLNIGFLETGDYLALGAIFSATDTVCTLQVLNQEETPLLYSLVFGEGVVNDATSVVLFNALQRFDLSRFTSDVTFKFLGSLLYLFSTSTFLGAAVGLLSAYIIKKLYFGRHSTNREVALMILMAYFSYMMAELLYLSGILTVFFCGIVMSHYTWHNVTEKSRVTTKHAFATMSFIAEIFIFLYVGIDALDIDKWRLVSKSPGTSIGVSAILFTLVMVGRAAFVFPLSFVANLTRSSLHERIGYKQQVIIWWAGLMRGAVSMALAYNQFTRSGYTKLHGNAILITSTISIVLFSTVVFGSITKVLVRYLQPMQEHPRNFSSAEPLALKAMEEPLLTNGHGSETASNGHGVIHSGRSLRMLLATPTNTVHHYWRQFDDACMRPVFGGRGQLPHISESPMETLS